MQWEQKLNISFLNYELTKNYRIGDRLRQDKSQNSACSTLYEKARQADY